MNLEGLEHRVYSETHPIEEHVCEELRCWCKPCVENADGQWVIVHNDIVSLKEKKEGH